MMAGRRELYASFVFVPRVISLLMRATACALFFLAIYWAQQHWRYQRAFARGEYGAATHIWPENAEGWDNLSQHMLFSDRAAARAAAERALLDDREDYRNWAQLAGVEFQWGDVSGARAAMTQMATRSVGYEATWSYANLLLLSDGPKAFWPEAEKALAMAPPKEIQPTLAELWQVAGNDTGLFDSALQVALPQNNTVAMECVEFLTDQDALVAAQTWWQLALRYTPRSEATNVVAVGDHYLGTLLAESRPALARAVWQAGLEAGVFPPTNGPSGSNLVTLGDEGALGWVVCSDCGPWANYADGRFSFQFQGEQPDNLQLARQWLLLVPARRYELSFQIGFQSPPLSAAPESIGVHVWVQGADGNLLVDSTGGSASFATPPTPETYRLEIEYHRPLGEIPLAGTVTLSNVVVAAAGQ